MKISRRLLKRSAFLSGIYLFLVLLLFCIIFNNLFINSQKEYLQRELLSMSKLIEQNYGIGDLISLRRNLSNIAFTNNWYESSFLNLNKQKYWEYKGNKKVDSKIDILWNLFTIFTGNTNFKLYILEGNIEIKSWDDKTVGIFNLKRNIKRAWISHLSRTYLIGFLLIISWFIYQILVWYVSQKTLKPLELLSKELCKSAESINLDFIKDSRKDEIQRIREWFNQIASAWKSERCKAVENERLAAIGHTTSMLAHDIRKPLSQVRVILDAFDMFKANPSRLETAKTDVKKAISNVEGMLADVMDFSREVKLDTEPKSLGTIFDFVIRQVVQGYTNIDIFFEYDFKARRKPLLDEERYTRVIANIIGNGIEAITVIGNKSSGTIHISTRNYKGDHPYTEIIIGNDGPPFPKGVEDQLFEGFYTSGKSKGTGLGLASAKKIVVLHEGEIFARNKEDGNGVEFIIRLPVSDELEDIDEDILPQHSNDVFQLKEDLNGIDALIKKMEGRVFKIVLLEDEALYRAWVKNLIQGNDILQKAVILYDASTVDEALLLVEKEKPSHAIIDIDLGAGKNGYDFLTAVQDNTALKTIIHSNRTLEEFKQKAKALGASGLVPKPLPLSSLVEFLTGEKIPVEETPMNKNTKKIYCCDDTSIIRDHLDYLFEDYLIEKPNAFEFEIFKNGEELIERAKKDKPALVFTDLNMQESSGQLGGYEVIAAVKKMSRKTKVYLISNEPIQLSDEPTRKAGGDGALEQPLSKELIYQILDKIFLTDARL